VAGLFPDAAWMVFGFGDRDYVLAESPGLGTSLAALWPGPGAILVTGLRVAPDAGFGAGASIPLRLPPGGMAGVAGFITASLATPEPLRPGPYPGSLFLPASRFYSAFYTCNTWTAEGLAAAGLPVEPAGILFAAQVNALGEALRAAGYDGAGRSPDRAERALRAAPSGAKPRSADAGRPAFEGDLNLPRFRSAGCV
jgi:hypothetical protein